MNRLWSRVGIRAASVGLLVAGVIGGVYLGQDREVQARSAEAQLVVQANTDEMALLKERHNQHAAARAYRSQAEGEAADKAATELKVAAGKALKLEKKAIEKKAAEEKAEKAAETKKSGTVPFTGDIPASCNEFDGNRATGCALTLEAGFGIDQFPCLNKLWNKESGWNHHAENPSSGAYGIPQSLPGSKMASVGDDWASNPATQIKWGLGYIKGRYGSPCEAWGHSQSVGWY
ncbi:lytic transglycosylase domain-containing protein [Actinoplanes sp. NPDC051859]|uniref:aggregation-promoting factor C-terminal-like domain-containing protein n=1 Tax=Actinoplanes sp. NPDC051859 TaxID=3363909 RepID=UPI0037B3F03C